MQHEIDHLDGVFLIFRMSALKRDLNLRKIRKMQRDGQWVPPATLRLVFCGTSPVRRTHPRKHCSRQVMKSRWSSRNPIALSAESESPRRPSSQLPWPRACLLRSRKKSALTQNSAPNSRTPLPQTYRRSCLWPHRCSWMLALPRLGCISGRVFASQISWRRAHPMGRRHRPRPIGWARRHDIWEAKIRAG